MILAGLDEHEALSGAEMETLQRELRMLLQIERFQIASVEVEKAEQVLDYMLRPSIEECLNLWFGKYRGRPTRRSGTASAPTWRWRRGGTTTTGRSTSSTRACWWRS